MRQIVALDGLRGLAILLVIFFHYGYLSGGWVGVQIFFVLSGYLISSILMRETVYPLPFYLKRFYWRRVCRIFPLYFACLLLLTVVMAILGATPAFRQQWAALFTYTYNFSRVSRSYIFPVYWGHLWSLSVEEQFYLIWPLAVYFTPARYWSRVCLGVIVLSPVLRGLAAVLLSHVSTNPEYLGNAIYNLTPCQLDAFATGAYVATMDLAGRKHDLRNLLLVSGIALAAGLGNLLVMHSGRLIGIRSFGYPINSIANYQHVWGFTLLNLWSAACILALRKPTWLTRIFEDRRLAYVGKISYGMYMFHVPIVVFFQKVPRLSGVMGVLLFISYFLVLLTVSHVSFRYFETWFLNLKDKAFVRALTLEKPVHDARNETSKLHGSS